MTSIDNIEQLVLQLNSSWFESKKEWFVKETFYSKNHERIFEEWEEPNWVWDDETNIVIELPPHNFVIYKNFNEYCWNGYYWQGLYEHEEEIAELPTNASRIADGILSEIAIVLKGIVEVKVNHKIILNSIDTISNALEDLQSVNSSEEYLEFLTFFLFKTKQKISKEYGHFKRAYDISESYKDKLDFNLKQDELAALLYILFKAEFINTPSGDTSLYLNFCKNYFHFKNQKKDLEFAPAKGIIKKFSEARGPGYSTKARESIITRLKKAFDEL